MLLVCELYFLFVLFLHIWLAYSLQATSQVKTKDYKIGICCFYVKHTALRKKSKDWLPRNQVNVSEWGDMQTVVV